MVVSILLWIVITVFGTLVVGTVIWGLIVAVLDETGYFKKVKKEDKKHIDEKE